MADDSSLPNPVDTDSTPQKTEAGNRQEKTLIVEGEPVTINPDTTVRDIKELVGAADTDVALYQRDGKTHALNDDDHVTEYVPDQGKLAFQAGKKQPFG